jgi:hypothetical protein
MTQLRRAIAEVGAIGRNLNQLARAANQGASRAGRQRLVAVMKTLFAMYAAEVPRWAPNCRTLLRTLRAQHPDVKTILVREYSTLSATTFVAIALSTWRLYERDWGRDSFLLVKCSDRYCPGLYFTMRYLKRRRIVYVPR